MFRKTVHRYSRLKGFGYLTRMPYVCLCIGLLILASFEPPSYNTVVTMILKTFYKSVRRTQLHAYSRGSVGGNTSICMYNFTY